MSFSNQFYDLPRILFSVIFIALMTLGCFCIVKPFILGFAWASIVVIATWPLMIKVQHIFWGYRSLAVILMILMLLLLFILPVSILISSIVNTSAPFIFVWAAKLDQLIAPDLTWLKTIPILGNKLYYSWQSFISGINTVSLINKIQPYIGKAISWLLGQVANLGNLLLHCGLMILFSILLYSRGEQVGMSIRHFAIRLGAERGDASVLLATQAIRAVALGIVLTSILQSVIAGIGLAITGIPLAAVLTVIMFILCIAQLGPLPVLIPAMIWLYWIGDTALGTVLLVWSCIVATIDNVLRPIFIHIGTNLPILLILCGVIGGILSFGMIGLFIGPVVLAVSWQLIFIWMQAVPAMPSDKIDDSNNNIEITY